MRRPARQVHPLPASQVLRDAGVVLPTGHTVEEELLRVRCDGCGLDQSLAEATTGPAPRPEDITAYRCRACGAELLVTGHPSPPGLHEPGRHRFGAHAIQPMTTSGMRMAPPPVTR